MIYAFLCDDLIFPAPTVTTLQKVKKIIIPATQRVTEMISGKLDFLRKYQINALFRLDDNSAL